MAQAETRLTDFRESRTTGVDGKISYDPETNTLTMEDVTINTTGENVGIRNGSVKGLKIVVVGNNTITAKSSCIAIKHPPLVVLVLSD